jgi:hypothetical protein
MENMTDAAIICSFGVLCVGAGLAFGDNAGDLVTVHDWCNAQAVQHRLYSCFFDKRVSDAFKTLGIECMTVRLWFGRCGAHRLGALFKFNADAFRVDGFFVPIPGKSFNTDSRNIAAKTAEALQQGYRNTRARRAESGC